jgi:hypothetical protein
MNKETKKNKNYIWSKIFNTYKRVMKMKGYEFKTIQTDGIGVSICFQKKLGRKLHQSNAYKVEETFGNKEDMLLRLE